MERLLRYFSENIADGATGETVGAEIETSFVNCEGYPISVAQSQDIFSALCDIGWGIAARREKIVTELADGAGNRILYELGRQNIELATAPASRSEVVRRTCEKLKELYGAANRVGAVPHFAPVLETNEELLVIPDERDAAWLRLDGKPALELLARISAVQFTVSISLREAVPALNRLGCAVGDFLREYPQDAYWRQYIESSNARYQRLRYGGPLIFRDLADYCRKLAVHEVVTPNGLIPFADVTDLNVPLFLRSVWWYFRLKRYGNQLCIEVRPLPRLGDEELDRQLAFVLGLLR